MNIKRINASVEEFNDQYVLVKMAMLMQDGEEATVERLSAISAKDVREVQTQAVQDMLAYLAGGAKPVVAPVSSVASEEADDGETADVVKPAQEAPIKRRGRKKKAVVDPSEEAVEHLDPLPGQIEMSPVEPESVPTSAPAETESVVAEDVAAEVSAPVLETTDAAEASSDQVETEEPVEETKPEIVEEAHVEHSSEDAAPSDELTREAVLEAAQVLCELEPSYAADLKAGDEKNGMVSRWALYSKKPLGVLVLDCPSIARNIVKKLARGESRTFLNEAGLKSIMTIEDGLRKGVINADDLQEQFKEELEALKAEKDK
ncbi:hypothetical protein DWX95_03385 [Butyricicoccus sp. AF22-28AC]|nr:hypothetical protein [Butyricicoccus sp. AF22-28AC]RHQ83803.1 hypothetical protein DWX95_03385 [Butyricicoccus sp. AF22-28AC]